MMFCAALSEFFTVLFINKIDIMSNSVDPMRTLTGLQFVLGDEGLFNLFFPRATDCLFCFSVPKTRWVSMILTVHVEV